MGASPRTRTLAALLVAAAPSCTLLNPLDHLQSGRDEDATTPTADGAVAEPTRETGRAELPGCEPEGWPSCGVTSVVRGGKPGGAVFVALGKTVTLYFTDEEGGTVSTAACSASECASPSVLVSGEDAPRKIAQVSGTVAWTTPTALRRVPIVPGDDAGVTTITTVTGTSDVAGEYPYFAWTDDTGAYACGLTFAPKRLKAGAARSPTVHKGFHFIADDAVQRNSWDGYSSPPASAPLPGTRGAELVAPAALYASFWDQSIGLVANVRRDAGSAIVVADMLDDAGAPRLLTLETEAVRALATTATYVYWTTGSGLLRRQGKDSAEVATVLRGLSGETSLAVSSDGLLAVVDTGRGEILTYASP